MNLLGRDYERIAMCSHPQGTHEHVPLKSGEDPPETCFADCDCVPVVFVRADLHRGAVDLIREVAYPREFLHSRSVASAKAREWLEANGLTPKLGR